MDLRRVGIGARSRRWLLGISAVLILAVLAIGAFPVALTRGWTEHLLSNRFGAPVAIGSMSRAPFFSFSPTVTLRDVRIAQPAWAGQGAMIRAGRIEARLPLWPLLTGRGARIEALHARDVDLALVRDAAGRANWKRSREPATGTGQGIADVRISNARFTLRDDKRRLALRGRIESDQRRFRVEATGQFQGSPARVTAIGPAIPARELSAPYPFTLSLHSPRLALFAKGTMAGALNSRDMALDVRAQASSLKDLDHVIEAGLFGTQPVDLTASVRHRGRDWTIGRLSGRIGRSALTGRAQIDKRDGRTRIAGDLVFAQLDFDDLADDVGLARQRALRQQIGRRVLPNTRVNLSRMGPTDGTIRFTAQRLLFREKSVLRSLRGTLRLDHRLLTVDDLQAGLVDGRMTGRIRVDHRSGKSPLVALDLAFRDGRLGTLLEAGDKVDAPFSARIRLTGRGDTVREAMARADGQIGLAATEGHVARIIASVMAQDMGKTIGAALGDGDAPVPLRCVAIGFTARSGKLTAAPFLIETQVGRSRGEGTIDLGDERMALAIGGKAREGSGLAIIDPIRIGGTLSQPVLGLGSASGDRKASAGIFGAIVKSIGGALGVAEKEGPAVAATGPIDCASIGARLLR